MWRVDYFKPMHFTDIDCPNFDHSKFKFENNGKPANIRPQKSGSDSPNNLQPIYQRRSRAHLIKWCFRFFNVMKDIW